MSGPHPHANSDSFSSSLLEKHLREFTRVKAGDRLCLAYSGGMDSHVLLHALHLLAQDFPFALRAVHVEHGLHEQSRVWLEHCEAVCKNLAIPLTVRHVVIDGSRGDSIEATARQARYAALRAELEADEFCLTAQHADDQAETLLLQLLRGAGMHGLAGMPVVARFGCGWLARPLLGFSRAALTAYAQKYALDWIDDPSNREDRFDRNYLRNRVMPLLKERWPAVPAALSRSARHAATAAAMLEDQGRRDLRASGMHGCAQDSSTLAYLDAGLLGILPEHRQANALRCWIRQYELRLPSHARLSAAIHDLLTANRTGRGEIVWTGAALRRDGDTLFLCIPEIPPTNAGDQEYAWDPACLLELPGMRMILKSTPMVGQGIALAHIGAKQLKVRWRRGGERCRMSGDQGRKPLRKLFQDLNVPEWQRDRAPLVFLDDELVAVSHLWLAPHLAPAENETGLVFSVLDPLA